MQNSSFFRLSFLVLLGHLTLSMAGCATPLTIHDVTETVPLVRFYSAKNPKDIAGCVVHALDTIKYPLGHQFINSMRELPGEILIVQQIAPDLAITFVVNIKPEGSGSNLRAHMSPQIVGTYGYGFVDRFRADYLSAMNSCR